MTYEDRENKEKSMFVDIKNCPEPCGTNYGNDPWCLRDHPEIVDPEPWMHEECPYYGGRFMAPPTPKTKTKDTL